MSEPVALLQIDIVDSTAAVDLFGDESMSTIWAEHDQMARRLLLEFGGQEIDRTDGFLFRFAAVEDAARCALAYHRALRGMKAALKARAGIHAGNLLTRRNPPEAIALGAKPIEVDGVAKAIAARTASLGTGGQTLLTAEARQSLTANDFVITSLGHWLLKGVTEPVELFEAADSDSVVVQPRDTDKAYQVIRHGAVWVPRREIRYNIPAESDSFIGRREWLHEIRTRMKANCRLASLVGAGGTGKTRLAIRFAWLSLGDFPGGSWFCDLAQARSIDGLVHAVAQGLDVTLGRGDPIVQLGDAIAGRGDCIVILDNFEQVAQVARETVGRWLERAPRVRFLVTSRHTLRIAGEAIVSVSTLTAQEAQTLFVERATAARHDLVISEADRPVVQEIVALLDGLPLAIELAAARVRIMSPARLRERMDQRFRMLGAPNGFRERHATLRAAFDWSWDLLADEEKSALARLSIFRGGFDLQAAEAILFESSGQAMACVDLVQSLVDKSLLKSNAAERFELLTTLQEYAAEQLSTPGRYASSGADACTRAEARHFQYFAQLGEVRATLGKCADIENLVAATQRAVAHGDSRAATDALQGAWAALRLRGPFRAAVDLAESVVSMAGISGKDAVRAYRLAGEAVKASGDRERARAHLRAALAYAAELGEELEAARTHASLGTLLITEGYLAEAARHYDAALRVARSSGDRRLECDALNGLGDLNQNLGESARAERCYEDLLILARAEGDRRWEGGALGNLGTLHLGLGRLAAAKSAYEAALAIAIELGDQQFEGNTLCNLGLLLHEEGHPAEAKVNLHSALKVARRLGHARLEAIALCNLGLVAQAQLSWQEALENLEAALGVASRLGDRRSEGQFRTYLGSVLARLDRTDEARANFKQAELLLAEVGDAVSRGVLLCARAELEIRLGDATLAAGWLAEAENLAAVAGCGDESELRRAIRQARSTSPEPS